MLMQFLHSCGHLFGVYIRKSVACVSFHDLHVRQSWSK